MSTERAAVEAAGRPAGVEILGPTGPGYDQILTAAAVGFVAELARRFGPKVEALLARRDARQAALDAGQRPDFLAETRSIRDSVWQVARDPRRPAATGASRSPGPTIARWSSTRSTRARNVFMADFEDSLSPTWANVVEGQINLRDAVDRIDRAHRRDDGKHYRLDRAHRDADRAAARLAPAPRSTGGSTARPVPGAFVDFGLYLFHNHAALAARGTGPYFYLPKLEGHLEARLWNEVFAFAEQRLGIAPRHDQVHGADRDDPRRLRDATRSSTSCKRPHRRPQLRALGLHLQLHQEVQRQSRLRAAGPAAADDDDALPALLLAAADPDLPPPRRLRDGRHGGADPDQERRARQRRGARQGARRQGARGRRRPRRHLGRAPGPRAARARGVRPADAGPEPTWPRSSPRSRVTAARPAGGAARRDHRGRACATTSRSASSTSPPGSAATAACRSTT